MLRIIASRIAPVSLLTLSAAMHWADQWDGYINPPARRFVIDPGTGLPTIPAHHGASAAP